MGAISIALINMSSAANDDIAKIARMLKINLAEVCDVWGRAPIDVAFTPGVQEAPDGWTPLVIFEQPDQPGCEGYHDVDAQGRPYGRAFRACVPGGVVLHDPSGKGASLAALCSHEAEEMAIDLEANGWFDGPFVDHYSGHSYAQVAGELADPVQELAYRIDIDGQLVDASDFIFPAWFNPRATGVQFDKCRALTAPLTLAPGGYAIVRDAKNEGQVFARLFGRRRRAVEKVMHPEPPAAWREQTKHLHGGRTKRRLTG